VAARAQAITAIPGYIPYAPERRLELKQRSVDLGTGIAFPDLIRSECWSGAELPRLIFYSNVICPALPL
jgi:hypothetical protein